MNKKCKIRRCPISLWKINIFLLPAFLLFHSFNVFSQTDPNHLVKLISEFDSLSKNNPPEHIYLQPSKDIYEAGEDLWFKAYILNSQFFIPSPLSQTLYLQVVNEETKTAVWQEKYEVINGFTDGHVFLQDTIPEGDYLLEAFTGHSFFNDSLSIQGSVRKIIVKKDMKPHPSFNATFNKHFYNPGDTIHMTITSLSEFDKPLYALFNATLYSDGKEITQKQAVPNPEGQATLDFVSKGIGDKLSIVTQIKYSDKEETKTFEVPCKKGSPVQFNTFPEGGNLVAGLPCKIAFKAVNIDGEPIDVTGTLFENDKPLLDFKSKHAGTGSFDFTPDTDKEYHIRLSQPIIDSTFLLPKIYKNGLTLHLDENDNEFLSFVVSQNEG